MAVQERLYTADDLWNMPDDGKIYELHNGVKVEMAGSAPRQSQLGMCVGLLVGNFIMLHKLPGAVSGADGTYTLNTYNTRIPDVAYVINPQTSRSGFYLGAPDLAIEIVSPSNSPESMQERTGEYISSGTRLVWIIDPEQLTIDVYRANGERTVLRKGDILTGDDVLPGLELPVDTIFSPYGRAL